MEGQSVSVQCNISASGGSNVYSPTIIGSTLSSIQMNMPCAPSNVSDEKPDRDWERRKNGKRSIQGYQKFLKANTSKLVQNVKNIDPIIDDLDLHKESIANVRAKDTNQKKMRELLDYVNCESIAEKLFNALVEHEASLMEELLP